MDYELEPNKTDYSVKKLQMNIIRDEEKLNFNRVLNLKISESRKTDLFWCCCSNCSNNGFRYVKELYCCHEACNALTVAGSHYREKMTCGNDVICITRHKKFDKVCLDDDVSLLYFVTLHYIYFRL